MSKKILAVSVAVLMMVVMAACGGSNPAVGDWVGDSVSGDSEEVSAEELEMVNSMINLSGFSLSMKKDNTFVMAMDMGGTSESVSGEWTEDNGTYTLTSAEQPGDVVLVYEDKQLKLELMEGIYMHFKKA